MQQNQVEIYSPGTGWEKERVRDGKILRGDVRYRRILAMGLIGFLLKVGWVIRF